jgi:hypothetical protein
MASSDEEDARVLGRHRRIGLHGVAPALDQQHRSSDGRASR